MSREHMPARASSGAVLQSSLPKSALPVAGSARGLLLRAVVTATYVVDDDNHPYAGLLDAGTKGKAVYCDVLVYSERLRYYPIQTVLVSQQQGGLHSGRIWKPRAAKLDITGNTIDPDKGTKPSDMDGDHVLVGFMDDSFSAPVIIGSIPHPNADLGNTDSGKQLRLKLADGDPDFWRHHGSLYGVKDNGDFLVDTRTANDGSVDSNGKEPAAPTDGKGSLRFKLPTGAVFEIEVAGDASKHPALAEYLHTLYTSLKSYIENAMVPTGMGPSGTVLAGSGPAPSWDSKIISTKVKIPDET